jgi:aminoglycoside 3-N-acetyltransferase
MESHLMGAENLPHVTRSKLVEDFVGLGVRPGGTIMLHASVKSVGWIVGGPDVILGALQEALGPGGTLMMYVGWEDGTYEMESWPEAKRSAYLEECPPFDPATSRAVQGWSLLTEYLRTTPGARRSSNPEASMAAIGARAEWLTADHPLNYGFGPRSPLEKLCRTGGEVLLLGTPLDTVTLLHYAESLADVPGKRTVRYRQPILVHDRKTWVEVEEFDTNRGVMQDYGSRYSFTSIVEDYLACGHGKVALVGAAKSYLFNAQDLTDFGVGWMEKEFGSENQTAVDPEAGSRGLGGLDAGFPLEGDE